jgi:hypothetical protein
MYCCYRRGHLNKKASMKIKTGKHTKNVLQGKERKEAGRSVETFCLVRYRSQSHSRNLTTGIQIQSGQHFAGFGLEYYQRLFSEIGFDHFSLSLFWMYPGILPGAKFNQIRSMTFLSSSPDPIRPRDFCPVPTKTK